MEPFLGEILAFGFNFAPRGWAHCDGQILPINQNQSLYSLLGTTYGGDGRTSFALPDLRGRVPMGFGQGAGLSNRPLGQKSGQQTVVLAANQIPSHTHSASTTTQTVVEVSNENGGESIANGQFLANQIGAFSEDGSPGAALGGVTSTSDTTISPTGGSQDHNNIQPFQVINYCIALQGLFPSRN